MADIVYIALCALFGGFCAYIDMPWKHFIPLFLIVFAMSALSIAIGAS